MLVAWEGTSLSGQTPLIPVCRGPPCPAPAHRTFPEHDWFSEPSSCGSTSLRTLLCLLALHSPTIGYCQSLNFLAGTLLLFLSDEPAFWLLAKIVDRLLPAEYFTRSMRDAYADQLVLCKLIENRLPRIQRCVSRYSVCSYGLVLRVLIGLLLDSLCLPLVESPVWLCDRPTSLLLTLLRPPSGPSRGSTYNSHSSLSSGSPVCLSTHFPWRRR